MKAKGIIGAMLRLVNPPRSLKEALVDMFTFANPLYEAAARYSPWGPPKRIPQTISLAREEDKDLLVPRGINERHIPNCFADYWSKIEWKDNRTKAPVKFPGLKIALTAEQKVLLKNFKTLLASSECSFGNILYVAPTSAGKTIFQAVAAKETKQRTLVLCLTELIKRAWFGDLEKAFGLAERDVGLIQRGTWRIGKFFTLASVMTLAKRKERWQELYEQFGCLIVDEADTITAPSIHQFVMDCPFTYLIGATATDSPGSRSFYLRSLFGQVRHRIVQQQKDTATSLALRKVQLEHSKFEFEMESEELVDWHGLTKAMMDDTARNELILGSAIRDWRRGHSVLIVTKRVEHAQILAEMLQENGVREANLLTGETNADRVYTEKLIEAVTNRNVRMVVATIQAIKRGANLNPLSVLHLAMPVANKRDLEQLIGRIRRRADKKIGCKLTYYLDVNVNYLLGLYRRTAIPVFRKLRVPEYI